MGPVQFKNLILPISVILAGIIFGGFYYAIKINEYESLAGQPQARTEQGNEEKQESGSTEQQSEKLAEQSPSSAAVGAEASRSIDKQPSWDPADYIPSNKPLAEQLKTDAWKLYVNPDIGLAFKYPPTWNLGRNLSSDGWIITLDTISDTPLEEMPGIFDLEIRPKRNKDLLSVEDFLSTIHHPGVSASKPYDKIAGVRAISIGERIYLTKDTYFVAVETSRLGSDIVRDVMETFVIEPSLENLTPAQKAVFQTNQWQPYVNTAMGFGFMYPPEWITARFSEYSASEEMRVWFTVGGGFRIGAAKAVNGYENALEKAISNVIGTYPPQNTILYGQISGADVLVTTSGEKLFFFTKNNIVFALKVEGNTDIETIDAVLKSFVFR